MNTRIIKFNVLIALSAALIFIPFLGGVHLFDWDEVNFAESAREMIVTRNFLDVQINFHPFWEKPPMFIWFQVLSMKMFGINEFAARLPNAICGIFTLLILFNAGRKLVNENFGLLWVMMYLCSVLPNLYFKSGIIDPWFNLFIFIAIYFFSLFSSPGAALNKKILFAASAFFIGLAILTKGPVALLIFFLTLSIYYIITKFKSFPSFTELVIFFIVLIITGGFWFIIEIINGRIDVVKDFIEYQVRLFSTGDAGHGGFLLYHFIVLFIGVFPASVFALPAFRKKFCPENNDLLHFRFNMLILFWVVLILFTIVKTKIVHYSSLCYFPLTFLGALTLYQIRQLKKFNKYLLNFFIISIASLYFLMLVFLPLVEKFKVEIINSGIIKDNFATGCLQAAVNWGYCGYIASGIFFILTFLIFRLIKNAFQKYFSFLILNFVLIVFAIFYTVPKIEKYAQNAAIEFYKRISDKNCYAETLGFKSYAQLFYTGKKPLTSQKEYETEWLLTGDLTKTAYFVAKNTTVGNYITKYPGLQILYEKNGFVFLVRKVK